MHIQEAIKNIASKRLDEMKQNVHAALSEKAVQKLEERKIEIAKNYFGKSNKSEQG